MRRLIIVPVIHTSADLGSIAKDVSKRGLQELGEDIWKGHEKTVEGFWDTIADNFNSIDATGMNIYQDGMIADGEMGRKIVEEGVKLGSKNYELVSRLLKGGAILVRTEDLMLVKEERDRMLTITQARSIVEKLFAILRYKLVKNRLLNKRDRFVVKRIDETLNQNQTGILFIGAYHNIKERLPEDIQIIEAKDTEKVREYQRLLPFYNKNIKRFEELGRYIISKEE